MLRLIKNKVKLRKIKYLKTKKNPRMYKENNGRH